MNKRLNAVITIGGVVTSALKSALGSTKSRVDDITGSIRKLHAEQRTLESGIQTFGRMGKNVDGLRVKYAAVTRELEKMRAAHQRLAAIENARSANLARRAELRGGLLETAAIGAAASTPIVQAAKFEKAMLGVAKQVDGARDKSGKLTQVYTDMGVAIQQLAREVPMATADLAAMVTAGARMGVSKNADGSSMDPAKAREQLIEFTRTSAMMAVAFEQDAGELADSMGKIAGLFKIPIPAIGKLADSINFLDDNAISKGGDIIDFLTRTGGVAASVRITGQEMAALGSTLLTLGERTETASTATNALFQKLAAADKGTKKFKAAMAEIGLSTAKVQKGMQKDAQGTVLMVLDAIRKLPQDKQLGVMVELVGLEHSDTLAKLANGVGEYRKQIGLATSAEAKGSMSREFEAQRAATVSQWQLMSNRVLELSVNIGSVLLPAVNSLLGTIAPVVSTMAEWAREHPQLTQAIVGTTVALVGITTGARLAGYAFTFLKGGILSVFGWFARSGPLVTGASAVLSGLGRVALWVATTALPAVGTALAFIGRALLLNPIGLAVTGIALAAFAIYKNWEPLKAWFTALWEDITATFQRALDWITQKIEWVGQTWRKTKEFFGFDSPQAGPTSAPGAPQPPAVPPVAGRGATVSNKTENTFNIYQQPGESSEAFARRLLDEQERRRRADARGAMYDQMAGAWG